MTGSRKENEGLPHSPLKDRTVRLYETLYRALLPVLLKRYVMDETEAAALLEEAVVEWVQNEAVFPWSDATTWACAAVLVRAQDRFDRREAGTPANIDAEIARAQKALARWERLEAGGSIPT